MERVMEIEPNEHLMYQRNNQGAKARPTITSPVASCGPDIIATNAATKTIQTVMPIVTPPTIPTPRLASMVGGGGGALGGCLVGIPVAFALMVVPVVIGAGTGGVPRDCGLPARKIQIGNYPNCHNPYRPNGGSISKRGGAWWWSWCSLWLP